MTAEAENVSLIVSRHMVHETASGVHLKDTERGTDARVGLARRAL
ncbi:hypothetical protein [Streptomyces sp. A012304]|nr:hypothetical protein [Streptomyces sp. A012304]